MPTSLQGRAVLSGEIVASGCKLSTKEPYKKANQVTDLQERAERRAQEREVPRQQAQERPRTGGPQHDWDHDR